MFCHITVKKVHLVIINRYIDFVDKSLKSLQKNVCFSFFLFSSSNYRLISLKVTILAINAEQFYDLLSYMHIGFF